MKPYSQCKLTSPCWAHKSAGIGICLVSMYVVELPVKTYITVAVGVVGASVPSIIIEKKMGMVINRQ